MTANLSIFILHTLEREVNRVFTTILLFIPSFIAAPFDALLVEIFLKIIGELPTVEFT
jgi:hypothetical protein